MVELKVIQLDESNMDFYLEYTTATTHVERHEYGCDGIPTVDAIREIREIEPMTPIHFVFKSDYRPNVDRIIPPDETFTLEEVTDGATQD